MKRYSVLLYAVAFTLCCVGASLSATRPDASEKSALVTESQQDLGTISPSSAPHKYEVLLRNTGQKPIRVTKITYPCTFPAPRISSNRVEPNSTATLAVNFIPEFMSGRVERQFALQVDDSTRPVEFVFTAEVAPILRAKGTNLTVHLAEKKTPAKDRITIENVSDQPVTINKIAASENWLRVDLPRKVLAPYKAMVCDISVLRPVIGSHKVSLNAAITSPSKEIIKIPAVVTVVSDVSCPELSVGFCNIDTPKSATVMLSGLELSQIKKVWTDCEFAAVRVGEAKAGGGTFRAELSLTVNPKTKSVGNIDGSVFVQTTLANTPFIEIPISGVVQPLPCKGCVD